MMVLQVQLKSPIQKLSKWLTFCYIDKSLWTKCSWDDANHFRLSANISTRCFRRISSQQAFHIQDTYSFNLRHWYFPEIFLLLHCVFFHLFFCFFFCWASDEKHSSFRMIIDANKSNMYEHVVISEIKIKIT